MMTLLRTGISFLFILFSSVSNHFQDFIIERFSNDELLSLYILLIDLYNFEDPLKINLLV